MKKIELCPPLKFLIHKTAMTRIILLAILAVVQESNDGRLSKHDNLFNTMATQSKQF